MCRDVKFSQVMGNVYEGKCKISCCISLSAEKKKERQIIDCFKFTCSEFLIEIIIPGLSYRNLGFNFNSGVNINILRGI